MEQQWWVELLLQQQYSGMGWGGAVLQQQFVSSHSLVHASGTLSSRREEEIELCLELIVSVIWCSSVLLR